MQNLKKKWVQMLVLHDIVPTEYNSHSVIDVEFGKYKDREILSKDVAQQILPFGRVFHFVCRFDKNVSQTFEIDDLENPTPMKDIYIYCPKVEIFNLKSDSISFGGDQNYKDYMFLPNHVEIPFRICPKSSTMPTPFLLAQHELTNFEYAIIMGEVSFAHDEEYKLSRIGAMINEYDFFENWSQKPFEIQEDGHLSIHIPVIFHYGTDDPLEIPHTDVSFSLTGGIETFLKSVNTAAPNKTSNSELRLPTNIEWEYASTCNTSYELGTASTDISSFVHHATNRNSVNNGSGRDSHYKPTAMKPVATLQANVWGFYDMFGNAAELVFMDEKSKKQYKSRNPYRFSEKYPNNFKRSAKMTSDYEDFLYIMNSDAPLYGVKGGYYGTSQSDFAPEKGYVGIYNNLDASNSLIFSQNNMHFHVYEYEKENMTMRLAVSVEIK